MASEINCIPLNIDWEKEIKEDQDMVGRHSYARTLRRSEFTTSRNDEVGGVDVYYNGELIETVQDDSCELGITIGDSNYDLWNNDGVVYVHGIILIKNELDDICNATSDDCIELNGDED